MQKFLVIAIVKGERLITRNPHT